MNKLRNFTIAMDFDDTLFIKGKDLQDLEPNWPVIKKLKQFLQQDRCEVALWTCREGEVLNEAIQLLKEVGIVPHSINENTPSQQKYIDSLDRPVGNRKILADLYIDDKAPGSIEYFLRIDVEKTFAKK